MPSTLERGTHLLRSVIGQQLRGVRRWVLDLGGANDEFGHGITELTFDDQILTFKPGPNEDFIAIERGAVASGAVDSRYFTKVDIGECAGWAPPSGNLESVDLLSNGLDDVGVLFRFATGETLLIALTDTDLVLARDESVFERDPDVEPVLRATIT